MTEHLSDTAKEALFAPLLENGWTIAPDQDAIEKSFKFKDFIEAFAWMTRAAFWAEKWDHHPDWTNTYNRVRVRLSTHDIGGLSALDAKLARKMDQLTDV